MGIELMLNAVNVNLVALALHYPDIDRADSQSLSSP
jgi:NADH:ubiquinone oxidoreductase subunit K